MDKTNDGDSGRKKYANSTRKRGHQHHNKFSGTRHSNVRAEEILAALRTGEQSQIKQAIVPPSRSNISDQEAVSATEMIRPNDSDNNNLGHSSILDRILNCSIHIPENNNGTNISSDTVISDCNVNSTEAKPDTMHDKEKMLQQSNNLENGSQTKSKDDGGDSMSSSVESIVKIKKSKRTSAKDSSGVSDRKRRSHKKLHPACERPPLEGADADNWNECNDTADVENDPEAAEWSKLRCTSERMEVVAEREYRRQNRRCADYPGLAFGRSIFSSDTMMKLQLIRNELHNIMKSQLKRVRVFSGGARTFHL